MRTLLAFLFGFALCNAQETLQLNKGQISPLANIQDVSWIAGQWKGEAFGGIAEEIWSPPSGGSMMFVFRLMNEEKVSFYEIGHIIEKGGTLLMQLKHFDAGLKGWEGKDETVDFKLVKLEKEAIYFEGLTIERLSENNIKFIVLVEENGTKEEMVFDYQKMK
jgi:hypothetical protein